MTLRKQFAHVARPQAPLPPPNIQVEAQADMHRDARETLKAEPDN